MHLENGLPCCCPVGCGQATRPWILRKIPGRQNMQCNLGLSHVSWDPEQVHQGSKSKYPEFFHSSAFSVPRSDWRVLTQLLKDQWLWAQTAGAPKSTFPY